MYYKIRLRGATEWQAVLRATDAPRTVTNTFQKRPMWLRGAVVWNFMWVEPLPVVLPAHIRKPPYYGYEFVKVALKEL